MNTKILKLALDANLINYIDHETPRVYFIDGYADIEDLEKFAESIIRECMNVLMVLHKEADTKHNYYHYAANQIKEHLGVKL